MNTEEEVMLGIVLGVVGAFVAMILSICTAAAVELTGVGDFNDPVVVGACMGGWFLVEVALAVCWGWTHR